MREKLKKDKEEAEKKRLAEENAAAEAKSRDPYSELYPFLQEFVLSPIKIPGQEETSVSSTEKQRTHFQRRKSEEKRMQRVLIKIRTHFGMANSRWRHFRKTFLKLLCMFLHYRHSLLQTVTQRDTL